MAEFYNAYFLEEYGLFIFWLISGILAFIAIIKDTIKIERQLTVGMFLVAVVVGFAPILNTLVAVYFWIEPLGDILFKIFTFKLYSSKRNK